MKKQLLSIGVHDLGMKSLRLPIELDLLRLVETRLQVTASSGGGKSFALRQIVEQAYKKTQIIILDPEGEFRTLRPTHDFVILGAEGDVQLVPRHAATYAHKFLELGRDLVVDLYELEPHQRQAFVRDFLNAMVNAPRHLWHDVLVILDEAHEFAPEKSPAVSSGAVISMASKGRKRGFALLLATQRPSKLSKDASAECQNKLIGLQNLPDDRKRAAEELGFTTKEEVLSLRDLDQGAFFACGPAFMKRGDRLRGIAPVAMTLPQTRPPKRGAGRGVAPAASAKLKSELKKLAELPREAEQELQDFAACKYELARVKAQLKLVSAQKPIKLGPSQEEINAIVSEAVGKEREKMDGLMILKMATRTERTKRQLEQVLHDLNGPHPTNRAELYDQVKADKMAAKLATAREIFGASEKVKDRLTEYTVGSGVKKRTVALAIETPAAFKAVYPKGLHNTPTDDLSKLSICQKKILAFLNTRPEQSFTKRKVATMSGYKLTGSFDTAVAGLNVKGLIVKKGTELQLGPMDVSDLVKGLACTLDDWIAKLGKCERTIFELLKANPEVNYSKASLVEQTGYQLTGSFDSALARLHTLGLMARINGGMQLDPGVREYA